MSSTNKRCYWKWLYGPVATAAVAASCLQLPAQQSQQDASAGNGQNYDAKQSRPAVKPETPEEAASRVAREAKAREKQDADRKEHNALVTPAYDFHYGKLNPFTPGNITVQDEGFLQPGAFPTAEYCGTCHQEAYAQWRQALHSNSFRTPFYRTSVNLLIRDQTRGIAFARFCDSCHNPIAVISGGLTANSKVDRTMMDADGLTCTTCHSVVGLDSTNGNASVKMGVPAVMVDEQGNRIPGQVPFADILRHPDRHSKAVMHDFLHTPEFCAACHKANLPATLNDYKFIRAFTAFDEWQQSKFSQRNPLTFYQADFKTCQTCHMMRNPTTAAVEYGAKHGTFASHRWLAGNTAVPFYYGFDDQLNKTIEFLRAGNFLNVDIFGLRKQGEDKLIAPLGKASYSLAPNDVVEAYVVVQNKNIGHSLIPEVRDLYEAWVEFTVKDSNGKDIYHSGFLKPDGLIDPRAHSFTNRPVTDEGDFVDNHKVWTIHSVAYDNTVQAGRSVLVRYQFRLPQEIKGPVSVTAKVNYRHLRQSYLNNIFGKDHPDYPVVELASRTRILQIGENGPEADDPSDNPEWMRWNNLGIALLDQFQYAESVAAFTEVVKLRHDYPDAYTNVGLTEIVWEKYDSARTAIRKALLLDPNNARALYYDGLLQRRAGNTQQEIADFRKVVEMFPESRDARRELGITYYQQKDEHKALEQFEALQKIDPDDLTAHYNLSILYRRMGMADKAADEQAKFVDKKVDPGAPTYSLNYLRVHPEISTESIPWHMHSDLATGNGAVEHGK